MYNPDVSDTRAAFQPTSWSLLERAAGQDETHRARALDELARRYWKPVYAFLRRRGAGRDEAADRTQAFFCYLLEHQLVDRADPAKGRFRSFLLGVLRRHGANLARKEHRLSRRLDPTSLEQWLPASVLSPEAAFERQWALDVLDRALAALEQEVGPERWEVLNAHLAPAGPAPVYAASAERLGLTEAAFTSALHRARRRLGQLVRAEAGDEVGELLDALG